MSVGNQREAAMGVRPEVQTTGRLDWRDVDQARRWARVGRCVAANDRGASVAYISSPPHSVGADAVSRRLDPVFDACFAGSGAVSRGVME